MNKIFKFALAASLSALSVAAAVHTGAAALAAENTEDYSEISLNVSELFENTSTTMSIYPLRYLAIGNSYLSHGCFPYSATLTGGEGWVDGVFVGWKNDSSISSGMAASEPSKDYFHRIQARVKEGLTSENVTAEFISANKRNAAGLERATAGTPTADTFKNNADFNGIKSDIEKYNPNIITIQLSENCQTNDSATLELFYNTVYDMVAETKSDDCLVVCISPFGTGTRTNAIKKCAEAHKAQGFYFADLSWVRSKGSGADNPYLAFKQYPQYDLWKKLNSGAVEFRSHPGDLGMDAIAEKVAEQLLPGIPEKIAANTVTLADSITISGPDSISNAADYTVSVSPETADSNITWTSGNEKIATVDASGKVTPVNNGTVTITAKSVYGTASGSKTITVTGQAQHFKLTYAAGTDDAVTNLPEADEYAKGAYTLSSQAPARAGYKFAGWALKENGETVSELEITADTTVYAVWEFAYSWSFNTDGYAEGVSMNAFNVTVKDGLLNGISYLTGLSFSADNLLINAADYNTFSFMAKISSTEKDQSYTVTINTTDGSKKFTAKIPDSSMQNYSFDITGLTGTITGFVVKASMTECSASVDEIAFTKNTTAVLETETSIRVKDPTGLRFKASIENSERAEAAQYGFIVARTSTLGTKELNHANMKAGVINAVEGISYDPATNTDIIFGKADDKTIFTAALINIPEKNYLEKLSVRAFVKIGDVYAYSNVYTDTLAQAAQRVKEENGELYQANKEFIDKILENAVKYDNESIIDASKLYD